MSAPDGWNVLGAGVAGGGLDGGGLVGGAGPAPAAVRGVGGGGLDGGARLGATGAPEELPVDGPRCEVGGVKSGESGGGGGRSPNEKDEWCVSTGTGVTGVLFVYMFDASVDAEIRDVVETGSFDSSR